LEPGISVGPARLPVSGLPAYGTTAQRVFVMPPIGRQDDADAALHNAHTAFRSVAKQRLKRLLANGVEDAAASSTLLDDLIEHREEQPVRSSSLSSSSPSVQHVIASTGASVSQASQIVRLKDEIGRLRREGHSTVTLIEQLKERLRFGGAPSWDENGEEQGVRRGGAAAGTASKKRRVGEKEEGAPSPPSSVLGGLGGLDAPARLSPAALSPASDYGFCGYLGDLGGARPFPADGKRSREDSAPLAQLKKLKLERSNGPTKDETTASERPPVFRR